MCQKSIALNRKPYSGGSLSRTSAFTLGKKQVVGFCDDDESPEQPVRGDGTTATADVPAPNMTVSGPISHKTEYIVKSLPTLSRKPISSNRPRHQTPSRRQSSRRDAAVVTALVVYARSENRTPTETQAARIANALSAVNTWALPTSAALTRTIRSATVVSPADGRCRAKRKVAISILSASARCVTFTVFASTRMARLLLSMMRLSSLWLPWGLFEPGRRHH